MLERLVADVLVRVLGQYLVGITPSTVSLGVWGGNLELHKLAVRPDALAVLLETLGLDLPVTCIAGTVGSLILRVPWKALRSQPVILTVRDLVVVASPVSDGDQSALEQRDARLKAARLEADDALREANFSVRAVTARLAQWRQRFTSSLVTTIVGNMQVIVENVIVQYQDASSVRERPYTVTIAVDSMRSASTDASWNEAESRNGNENEDLLGVPSLATHGESDGVGVVRKVVHLVGLVGHWIPGIGDSSHETLDAKAWASAIRSCTDRRVIQPMSGRLRISLAESASAAISAMCPKVELDLCFPEVQLAFDDFQYHTLLSTIMYLSDIDRKVRPKSPRGRWLWALERLLPRFKDRYQERNRFTAEGLRNRREQRLLYVRARKAVVSARMNNTDLDLVSTEVSVLRDMELLLSLSDVLLFRDNADRELASEPLLSPASAAASSSRFWRSIGGGGTEVNESSSFHSEGVQGPRTTLESPAIFVTGAESPTDSVPSLRMAFLLGRGSIQLNRGGFPEEPVGISRLVFHELRLGVTTWSDTRGLLIEALLGTLNVIDLQSHGHTKVLYPRVEWAGRPSTNVSDENSYPEQISMALDQIRGSYEKSDPFLFCPTETGLKASPGMGSSGSSSRNSLQSEGSSGCGPKLEDISFAVVEPLNYLVALRLQSEDSDCVPEAEARARPSRRSGKLRTRLAMDLAIGGIEAVVDGPSGSFVSSFSFWHPREKLPSIMQFLGRAAAPRLASLRMDLQRVLEDRKAPMRMDLLIQGPRFVFPGPDHSRISLVLDLGTFAMETFDGRPVFATPEKHASTNVTPVFKEGKSGSEVRCTDYRMTGSDLGIFIVSEAGSKAAERLVKPFSLRVLVQVLNDAAYIEAVMGDVDFPVLSKLRMFGRLSSVRTTVSHGAFRNLLKVAHQWSEWTSVSSNPSGIEPNSPRLSSCALPLSIVSASPRVDGTQLTIPEVTHVRPRLTTFDLRLELDNLLLELRDSSGRRVVTLSTKGTGVKLVRQTARIELDFRIQSFTVEDGSRGATAPFRQLVYAGLREGHRSASDEENRYFSTSAPASEDKAFVYVRYTANTSKREQEVVVSVISLSIVCVRETYLALADFFYQSDDVSEECFVDPFVSVGMTTSEAVLALRDQAGRGVELSKQAFAQRGELKVTAILDGIDVTLVAAEGAIALFQLQQCSVCLRQSASGDVHASGNFQTLAVRDLTAVYDIHSQAMTYQRKDEGHDGNVCSSDDGWTFDLPTTGDKWWRSRLTNLRIVYVHRFVVILRQYLNALRDELQPILSLKGGLAELFERDAGDSWKNVPGGNEARLRLDVLTKNIDVIMPRHSQNPHEALRFFVESSSVTNDEPAAPGYVIGMRFSVTNVSSYVLYTQPDEGERIVQPIHFVPRENLVPFSTDTAIFGKLDMWRTRRVPRVVLNSEGNPVLKEGELEIDYNPRLWLPALRARLSSSNGITARLCEAEYSILYFIFTENIIERPEIEFTDIVRGLKTPILPPRRPVQPIMLSSNRMPPNYSVVFDIPSISSVIQAGDNPSLELATLLGVKLREISGRFDYGVDYRMSLEVAADVKEMRDLRPRTAKDTVFAVGRATDSIAEEPREKTITLSWDRPYGHRANIMLVASALRIIAIPDLFRDLGILTTPGFPFLESSAPAPFVQFNGRLLIITLSDPEIWLLEDEYDEDSPGVRVHGDVIAKVQWSAVTGRLLVEVASKGLGASLCHTFGPDGMTSRRRGLRSETPVDTPLVYPLDVSLRYHAGGYDPAPNQCDSPIRRPGSTLSVDAESLLARMDVKDTPLLLAIFSRFVLLPPSVLSSRSPLPGRFDEWADTIEEGDAKLSVHFALPHARVLFTDEILGRHVPIMEIRARDALLRSNVPWLTNARVELSVDLFNGSKGWWEPGIEKFPIELTTSQGRSGSIAINARSTQSIDMNITPSTVSGAARVAKSIKGAVEGLQARIQGLDEGTPGSDDNALSFEPPSVYQPAVAGAQSLLSTTAASPFKTQLVGTRKREAPKSARRPSVAAFCVQNWTGRPASVWQKHVSARLVLRGDGGEVEMDLPTDQAVWPVLEDGDGIATDDANRNRHALLRCSVAMSGYRAISLSAAEVGVDCFNMIPEQSGQGNDENVPLQVVWDVSMRDGVPVACLRSAVRIINKTDTVLEVGLGDDLNHSAALLPSMMSSDTQLGGSLVKYPFACSILEAGETFHVPLCSIDQVIRIRPAIFSAPEANEAQTKLEVDRGSQFGKTAKQSVLYSYKWSQPLSKLETFRKLGVAWIDVKRNDQTDSPVVTAISCAPIVGRRSWTFTVAPIVRQDHSLDSARASSANEGWVDLELQAPFVLENCMPLPLSFAIADSQVASTMEACSVLAGGNVEPLRRSHIHTAGNNLSKLALGLGYDNIAACYSGSDVRNEAPMKRRPSPIHSFHSNIAELVTLPVGLMKSSSLFLRLEHEEIPGCRSLAVYSDFWLQNRSDVDLFFKDFHSESHGDGPAARDGRPKMFLRGSPHGHDASPYVCFSGSWLSLQRGNATEDIWVQVPQEVSEIDKPIPLRFQGLGLSLDVRPARGKFRRSLIATVRNTGWIENHTAFFLQWCQSAALSARGILLSSHVHTLKPWKTTSLHWDFLDEEKSICLRRVDADGSSTWMWSRPIAVEGVDGEFAAKMYRPNRHEQYIARAVVFNLKAGAHLLALHPEDRNNPPYRIVNQTNNRSIAFRQSGSEETHPWLVRPGKATRYSWDNPRAPLKRRSLLIEVIEHRDVPSRSSSVASLSNVSTTRDLPDTSPRTGLSIGRFDEAVSDSRLPKFELSIDVVSEEANLPLKEKFSPQLSVSVCVDGPTKVVTFRDVPKSSSQRGSGVRGEGEGVDEGSQARESDAVGSREISSSVNVDVEVHIKAVGISLIDKTPCELLFVNMSDLVLRLDRFESYELLLCEVGDLQIDNQLPNATWPVLMWSPARFSSVSTSAPEGLPRQPRKPFFQLSMDGKYPRHSLGICQFRGIFAAFQHVELALDEDCLLRLLLFGQNILEASGEGEYSGNEDVSPNRVDVIHVDTRESNALLHRDVESSSVLVHRLYVEQLELCPLKLTVSFASSRSSLDVHVAGYRNLMRTLMAVFGNVDKADFRFNALELRHVFDTTMHFQSLIAEFYVAQSFGQKMALIASNPLVGNPSALFDSIAMGTRDFFIEPSRAKGSADFIAGIGRGSSSLLTNTVGGIVGSLGGIPRAVAQGLETAVGDREYLATRDSIRSRSRYASSPAEGLMTGAMSFGHGIASGATGLVRDPMIGAMENGAGGFFRGLGKGMVGGVLKPIAGALDLIGEPAVGFRSMMTSSASVAEPIRPARAFWGTTANRLVTYDLHAALGQAVLESVGRWKGPKSSWKCITEELWAWVPLVAVYPGSSSHDLILFLWALKRRSHSGAPFRSRSVLDGHGEPQQAGSFRCGLVTQMRVVVTSLLGRVLWECPLTSIVDTQVSLEHNDVLMIGANPSGYVGPGVPSTWERIACGSSTGRDALNSAVKKALNVYRGYKFDINGVSDSSGGWHQRRVDGNNAVELVDMSSTTSTRAGRAALTPETQVGSRGVPSVKADRRRSDNDFPVEDLDGSRSRTLSEVQGNASIASIPFELLEVQKEKSISLKILLQNECQTGSLVIDDYVLSSGAWLTLPSKVEILPGDVLVCDVIGDDKDTFDLSGAITVKFCEFVGSPRGEHGKTNQSKPDPVAQEAITLCFMIPFLEANEYVVHSTEKFRADRVGGDTGNHAQTVVRVFGNNQNAQT